MFKFLFEKMGAKTVVETQRDTVTRAVDELNSVLALMGEKPKVGFDLNSGLLSVDLPDQMPDEALALPAPEEKAASEVDEGAVEESADDAAGDMSKEKTAA